MTEFSFLENVDNTSNIQEFCELLIPEYIETIPSAQICAFLAHFGRF